MYGGAPARRRAVYSPFQKFEFLVFLIPVFFFVCAFIVIYMTIVPSPDQHHSPVFPSVRTVKSTAPRSSTALRCGHPMMGVSAEQWNEYCGGVGDWMCRESRELIGSALVNDDYCDCEDGSDEVGTSACSHTGVRFTCKAQQYITIPTSMVNDLICDCCDGYDSTTHTFMPSAPPPGWLC
jgi:hypothetical protein